MKQCSCCKVTKEFTEFYKQSGRQNGTSYCKSCKNKYDMERWVKRKLKAIEYKGGECNNCGYNKCYAALEFHHTDPSEKDYDWGKLRLRAWPQVLAELDKCVLLCANCHRELHNSLSS